MADRLTDRQTTNNNNKYNLTVASYPNNLHSNQCGTLTSATL